MNITAYTYDADYHCESCMLTYARAVPYQNYDWQDDYYSDEDIQYYKNQPGITNVATAVELEIIKDSENNPIHPVFSTDEWFEPTINERQTLTCSDCGALLDEIDPEEN